MALGKEERLTLMRSALADKMKSFSLLKDEIEKLTDQIIKLNREGESDEAKDSD